MVVRLVALGPTANAYAWTNTTPSRGRAVAGLHFFPALEQTSTCRYFRAETRRVGPWQARVPQVIMSSAPIERGARLGVITDGAPRNTSTVCAQSAPARCLARRLPRVAAWCGSGGKLPLIALGSREDVSCLTN